MENTRIDEICKKIDSFIDQYELDMRGDKNMDNGNRGVIGEIREIKKYHKEYPSILWLLKHYPLKVGGIILFLFLFLSTLSQIGMLKFLLVYFGVPIAP